LLEVVTAGPVKEVQRAVVSATHKHIISVYSESIDYSIMLGHCPQLVAFWTLPDSDLI
jgi:hypothetical protein